jgi:hypothetical protein
MESRRLETPLSANFIVRLLVSVDRQQEDQVSYLCSGPGEISAGFHW